MDLSIMESKPLAIIEFGAIGLIVVINIIESIYKMLNKAYKVIRTNRIAFTCIGIIGGSICALHSYGEFAYKNEKMVGLFFEANTGRSLLNIPTDQWTGWIALSIIPSFLISGIIVSVLSIAIFVWCIIGVKYKNAGLILICIFLTAMIFGGGFIPIFIGIIAGIFGIRMQFPKSK
jgi:hypothetical protein